MADGQKVVGGVEAGSKDWVLPGDTEILLKAVNAEFTDNGASGDWLPCLTLISDSGHMIARCCDPNVVVTAGDDAEASFFPGVKPSAASAPSSSTLAVATARRQVADGTQSVTTGAQVYASLPLATSSHPSIMDWSTTVNPNDTLNTTAAGTYLAFWNVTWDFQDLNVVSIIMTSSLSGPPHQPFFADGLPLFGAAAGMSTSQDYSVYPATTGGGSLRFQHSNNFGSTRFVQTAEAIVVYLGTG